MEKNEKKEVETKVEDKANKTEDKKDKKETTDDKTETTVLTKDQINCL